MNFSDPLGLAPCPPDDDCWSEAKSNAILADVGRRVGSLEKAVDATWSVINLANPAGEAALGAKALAIVGRVARLAVPVVEDTKLGNMVRDLYKGAGSANPIGTGSTADAIRYERLTGNPVGGRFHTDKGSQYLRGFNNWLANNANAAFRDQLVARSIRDDLAAALRIP